MLQVIKLSPSILDQASLPWIGIVKQAQIELGLPMPKFLPNEDWMVQVLVLFQHEPPGLTMPDKEYRKPELPVKGLGPVKARVH